MSFNDLIQDGCSIDCNLKVPVDTTVRVKGMLFKIKICEKRRINLTKSNMLKYIPLTFVDIHNIIDKNNNPLTVRLCRLACGETVNFKDVKDYNDILEVIL